MSDFKERMGKIFPDTTMDISGIDGSDIKACVNTYRKLVRDYLNKGLCIPDCDLYYIVKDCNSSDKSLYATSEYDYIPDEDKLYDIIYDNEDAYEFSDAKMYISELFLEYPDVSNEVIIKVFNTVVYFEDNKIDYGPIAYAGSHLLHDDGDRITIDLYNYIRNKDDVTNQLRLLRHVDEEGSPVWSKMLKYIGLDYTKYVKDGNEDNVIFINNCSSEVYKESDLPEIIRYNSDKYTPYTKEDAILIMDFYRDLIKNNIISVKKI